MALQVHGLVAVRKDRGHRDPVSILHLEGSNHRPLRLFLRPRRKFYVQDDPLLVGFDAFNLDLAQGSRDRYATRHFQHIRELRLVLQFVNRRTLHHSRDRYQRPHGGNENGVARFQVFDGLSHSANEQIVEIHLAHQLLSAIMLHQAQRTGRGRSSGNIQRIERSGE